MRFTGPTLILAGLLWATSVPAQDGPYASIVARNMFGLVPIPPPDPHAGDPPVDPPPKITPTGIMTIFGRDQALFKVGSPAKPGVPAKEESYVLSEGERQDDIEIVKIDHDGGIITFDNHGTIQELPLVPAKDSGGSGGAPGGAPSGLPGFPTIPRPGMFPRPGMARNVPVPPNPGSGMVGSGMGSANPYNGAAGGGNGSSALTSLGGTQVNGNRVYQPQDDPSLTPEQNVLLIEAQRMQYLQNGDKRGALMPTTPITQQVLQQSVDGQP